jgi:hypothetical protein
LQWLCGGCTHQRLRAGARRAASLHGPDAPSQAPRETGETDLNEFREPPAELVSAPARAAGTPELLPLDLPLKCVFPGQPAAEREARQSLEFDLNVF